MHQQVVGSSAAREELFFDAIHVLGNEGMVPGGFLG